MSLYKTMKQLLLVKKFRKFLVGRKYKNVHEVAMSFDQFELRFNTEDKYSKRWFLPRYAHGKVHEPGLTHRVLSLLDKSSCFVDVGANLGYFTCLAAKACCEGNVHAFEMDNNCIPLIEANLKLNGCKNAKVNNMAVSNQDAFAFIPAESGPNPELMFAGNSHGPVKQVQTIKLDSYIKQLNLRPDLIKIDAEGAEKQILEGAREFLSHPNAKLFVEIHCNKLPHYGATYNEVLDLLIAHGFHLEEIVSHRLMTSASKVILADTQLSGNVMVFASK